MWKYINKSNIAIPSRNIEWEFQLPYILKIHGSLFWKGWGLCIQVLVFRVGYTTNLYCGRYIKIGLRKWFAFLSISHGWNLCISIGVSFGDYLNWKIRRILEKNLTDEQLKRCLRV